MTESIHRAASAEASAVSGPGTASRALRWLPLAVLVGGGLLYGGLWSATEGGAVRELLAPRQAIGTLTLFVLLSAYVLAMVPIQRRRVFEALRALSPWSRADDRAQVEASALRFPGPLAPGLVFGGCLGVLQNPLFIRGFIVDGRVHPLDVAFVIGACAAWAAVGVVLSWRVRVDLALSRLGRHADLDLYRLDRFQPLAGVAIANLLMVAGAMALTPLQSLDAEFRFGNYWSAIVVGGTGAVVLYVVPLWGMRENIRARKSARITELQRELDDLDRSDLARLDLVMGHIARVRTIPDWPVDLGMATRIFVYVIIPPLAWIAAAFVEGWVEAL